MPLTPLARRLQEVARSPQDDWLLLAENVPQWPVPPASPARHLRRDGDLRYAPSQGLGSLLSALRARESAHGADVGPESILVTNGAFDALGLISRHLAATGVRRAVCAGPVHLSVVDLLAAIGLDTAVVDWQRVCTDRAWTALGLGPADLLYLNSPHNPTGSCLRVADARALLDAHSEHGFAIIFDLVYDSFIHSPDATGDPLSLVQDLHGVYGINSFSKNYGVPGLRVGWIVAEPMVVEHLTARLEWERIAVSTAAQSHAARLCAAGNTALIDRVAQGRRIVLDWAGASEVPVSELHGGVQAWADLRVSDSEQFADALMLKHQIVLATGANYYPAQPGRIRIPLGVDPAALLRALPAIAAESARFR